MQQVPSEGISQEPNNVDIEGGQEEQDFEEDYYSNFARRVYMLSE